MEPISNGNSFSTGNGNSMSITTGWDPTLPPLLYPNPARGLSRELVR